MKRFSYSRSQELILLFLCYFLTSCNVYNFSAPLPVDVADIPEFPEAFLGKWKEDTFHTSIEMDINTRGQAGYYSRYADNKDLWTYQVFPQYIQMVFREHVRVIRGAWPKLDSEGNFIYPATTTHYYDTEQDIKYDTNKKAIDTIDNFLCRNGKIYEMAEHYRLEKGYPFVYEKDTIVIQKFDTVYLDLGHQVKLKKITDSLYALNILRSVLGSEDDGGWWILLLLEIKPNGQITEWDMAEKGSDLPEMIYDRSSKSTYLYFDAHWNKSAILRLKKDGYFAPTGTLVSVQ